MPVLVWAYDPGAAGPYHLTRRNGDRGMLCGTDLPYATARYVEGRPLHEDRACQECVSLANEEGATFPW